MPNIKQVSNSTSASGVSVPHTSIQASTKEVGSECFSKFQDTKGQYTNGFFSSLDRLSAANNIRSFATETPPKVHKLMPNLRYDYSKLQKLLLKIDDKPISTTTDSDSSGLPNEPKPLSADPTLKEIENFFKGATKKLTDEYCKVMKSKLIKTMEQAHSEITRNQKEFKLLEKEVRFLATLEESTGVSRSDFKDQEALIQECIDLKDKLNNPMKFLHKLTKSIEFTSKEEIDTVSKFVSLCLEPRNMYEKFEKITYIDIKSIYSKRKIEEVKCLINTLLKIIEQRLTPPLTPREVDDGKTVEDFVKSAYSKSISDFRSAMLPILNTMNIQLQPA